MASNCIAAPAIVETVQISTFSGAEVSREVILAKAVSAPSEDQVERARKECLAVSMYEESVRAGQSVSTAFQVAFSFTFSQAYPVMLCGILPLNTAQFSSPGTA